jgi:hypothetical protein
VHTRIHTISLLSTKLNNDWINSLVGLTYHHFIVHSIVVTVVLIVVLTPSNLIDNSAVCINVRGTSRKSRTIATRILHRCFGMLKRASVARFPTKDDGAS